MKWITALRKCGSVLNSNIRCIEIRLYRRLQCSCKWLNSNIRCIEIKQNIPYRKHRYCWIVTLDVLKYIHLRHFIFFVVLNSNIRCIEIFEKVAGRREETELNSNIRCIEIFVASFSSFVHVCWIVTLDVLKCWNVEREHSVIIVE